MCTPHRLPKRSRSLIRNFFPFVIGILLLLGSAFFAARTIAFTAGAEEAVGTVRSISSYRSTCSRRSGRRSRSYPCMKYTAKVGFITKTGMPAATEFSAGSCNLNYGNCSSSSASRPVGSRVSLLYDRIDPAKTRENSVFGIWGHELGLGFIGGIFLIASLFEARPRRRYF